MECMIPREYLCARQIFIVYDIIPGVVRIQTLSMTGELEMVLCNLSCFRCLDLRNVYAAVIFVITFLVLKA